MEKHNEMCDGCCMCLNVTGIYPQDNPDCTRSERVDWCK